MSALKLLLTSIISCSFMLLGINTSAQRYFTKTGKISFDATAPASPENIVAKNRAVTCVIDTKTGQLQFAVLMKSFEFERALMQEHFNENYVESDKFPKAEFKGQVDNNTAIDYSKDGSYNAKVKGKLTIHGETKDVETSGKIVVKDGKLQLLADFSVVLSDYKITIPTLVADKVAKSAKISVDCSLEPLK
jgi:polyisoprenoid-binding protein YceI